MATAVDSERLCRQKELIALLRGRVELPTGANTGKQGVSEQQFLGYLQQYFPNVHQGLEFPIPDSTYCYCADFVIYHELSGLAIDLEIDEPYVGNTKEPHHCVDQGKDSDRNQFFTNRNWVVIRFSEMQVVQHPLSCCKVIASVIAQVTGDSAYLSQLFRCPDLPPQRQWTLKEARRMARADFRNTYLPKLSPENKPKPRCRSGKPRKHY